jgi:curli biogenesis system outer membrane secretion channel CsgG
MKLPFISVVGLIIAVVPSQAFSQTTGKPIVAIYKMDDLAGSRAGPALSSMIETAIEGTSKFRVIEREQLDKLVGEQSRAKAGLITTNTPGKTGGFDGVDFLIYGTITSLSVVNKADLGSSLIAGIFAGNGGPAPSCSNAYATLGLDVKITDAATGEVRYVTHIDEKQKSASSCGQRAQIDAPTLERSAAEKVASGLVTAIYPIQIAAVQSDGVMILNYGQGTVEPGAIFTVYVKGDAIRDPATGEVIANNETRLGLIRVTEVTGRISKAAPASDFASAAPVGSIVRASTSDEIAQLSKQTKRH